MSIGSSSDQPAPDTPPPTYSESTALKPGSAAAPPSPGLSQPFSVAQPPQLPSTVAGPTPLSAHGPAVLPYYDPRSPYSRAEARRRARRRFLGAMVWALVFFALCGGFTGTAVQTFRR